MANYTISIEDILEMNKQEGEELDNLTDLCTVAKRALFNKCDLTVIDEDFIDRFVTQFAIHYLDHEICCPSEFKWRLLLAGQVMENAELINSIFDNLENQIFSEYDTRTVTDDISETIHDDGTVENDGTVTNAKSGSDDVTRTGSESNVHSGSIAHADSGYNELVKSGTETHTYNNVQDVTGNSGKDTTVNDEHYTDTVINDEHYSDRVHDESRNDQNTGTYGLDTPQDQVTNLRSAAGGGAYNYDTPGNAGINASSNSSMKYMSSATISDGTSKDEKDQTTWHNDGGEHGEPSQVTTKHDDGGALGAPSQVETKYGRQTTNTKSGSETDSYTNRSDRTNFNSTHTDTFNNETNTRTLNNLKDTTHYASSDTRTDDLTMTKHNTNVKTGNNTHTEVSNKLNWELLLRCEGPMAKIWNTFDKLFWPLW